MVAFFFIRVFSAIVFGAMGLGNASAFAPDVGKAQNSAKRIIALIDSEPTLDHTSTEGGKLQVRFYFLSPGASVKKQEYSNEW